MTATQPPVSTVQKLWSWLMTGHVGSSGASFGYFTVKPHRWFGAPLRIYRVLAARRALHPVPMLYIFIGVIGLGVGVVLQWLTGFPWWIAPLVSLVAAWLFFFSTIWRNQHLHSTKLSTELIRAIDPQKGALRLRQETIDRVMASGLPMLGLRDQPEQPVIGGMSWDSTGIQQMSIRYNEDRQIQVTDSSRAWDDAGMQGCREPRACCRTGERTVAYRTLSLPRRDLISLDRPQTKLLH